jgi:cytochrome c biogenesis protein CcmG, thiol:disulfide interchange protein DsbE
MRHTHFVENRRHFLAVLPVLWAQPLVWAQNTLAVAAPTLSPAWVLPLWTAQGSASKDLSSSDLLGQWVYLDFWASWCGPCKQSFPWMGQLQQQMRDAKFQVVAVGLDKQAAPMERFLKQFPGHVQVVWDPLAETAKRFDVQAMPSSYLINPAGQVVWRHRGFHLADSAALLGNIRQRVLG